MRRGILPPAAAAAAAALLVAGCGEKIEIKTYDPPAERSAGGWSTWVIGDPARLRVPPPPAAGSAREEEEERELDRLAERRDLTQERRARYWAREPTVLPWLDFAMSLVARRAPDPPAASRAYALVSVAMYDAAVATWHWKYRYRRKPPGGAGFLPRGEDPSYPSEHAAVATAAARVLTYVFPEQKAGLFGRLARQAGQSRTIAGTNFPTDVEAGMNLGRAVGEAVVGRARQDGYTRRWDGSRPTGRGSWEPPPGTKGGPIQPLAGQWKPWVLRSGSQLRPPDLPDFGSAELRDQARRVMEARDRITARQKRVAQFWEGGEGTQQPPGIWNGLALARVRGRGLSIPRTARVFALLNVAMADAGTAAWDAKYTYWSPRPENAIRDLGLDRNWSPLLKTPLSPAYVSGRSAYAASAAGILADQLPKEARRLRRQAGEAAASSVYGGINYPRADERGRAVGARVAQLVLERAGRDGALP